MSTIQAKEYFGLVGNNQESVENVYHSIEAVICTKTLSSLDTIKAVQGSLGAIAYIMNCQSEVHGYNLEYIHGNFFNIPLYVISHQISIPMLHHALKLGAKDVLHLPLDKKMVLKLSQEVNTTTNIECFQQSLISSDFIPATEEVIAHPLEELFELIELHFTDPPSLQKMSTKVYLSPSRISHMFKDLCGIGYTQYILCRRLEESEFLLAQENASVTQISFQLGFSNPSHFCRNFKAHIGLTPSAYIKHELGIELSCLYQRYQKLRMEVLPIANIEKIKLNRLANH